MPRPVSSLSTSARRRARSTILWISFFLYHGSCLFWSSKKRGAIGDFAIFDWWSFYAIYGSTTTTTTASNTNLASAANENNDEWWRRMMSVSFFAVRLSFSGSSRGVVHMSSIFAGWYGTPTIHVEWLFALCSSRTTAEANLILNLDIPCHSNSNLNYLPGRMD